MAVPQKRRVFDGSKIRANPSLRDPGLSLGFKSADVAEIGRQVKSGLSYEKLLQFQKQSQLSMEDIRRVIQAPKRTLARRKAQRKLTPSESERLVRLALVFEKALGLFEGDAAGAREWLETAHKALGNEAPLQVIESEFGAREVEDLIGRLEHGVFA